MRTNNLAASVFLVTSIVAAPSLAQDAGGKKEKKVERVVSGAGAAAQQAQAPQETREIKVNKSGEPNISPEIAKMLEQCGIDLKALSRGAAATGGGTITCNLKGAAPRSKAEEALQK